MEVKYLTFLWENFDTPGPKYLGSTGAYSDQILTELVNRNPLEEKYESCFALGKRRQATAGHKKQMVQKSGSFGETYKGNQKRLGWK